jgi:hypothetical protein
MSSPDPAAILADTIRQRLAVVEEVCRALTSTVGTFGDPDKVFRDLAHMRTQIDLARQGMIKSELVQL